MSFHSSSIPDGQADYFRQVRKSPMLEAQQEAELVTAWRERGDEAARRQLVESHLRLVVKTAGQFKGYGLSVQDLIAEGNLGLVRALDGFDPARGLRFATYAQWWIRAAMFEFVLKFSTPVTFGLSAERKRLFFKLRGLKNRLNGPESRTLDPQDRAMVARQLGVGEGRVAEMEQLLTQSPRSMDAPVGESGASFGELMADDRPNQEEILAESQELMYRRDLLKAAWTHLNEREQDILTQRTLRDNPLRLEDLAQRYNISRERVRQIEAGALKKLKTLLTAMRPRTA